LPDFLEAQGLTYNEGTFDDIFVKKFKDVVEDVSTDSSEEEGDVHEQDPTDIDSSS
jgi:hypothetical protein